MCSRACRITWRAPSMNCCPARGLPLAMTNDDAFGRTVTIFGTIDEISGVAFRSLQG
jgi:hypothetical protein